MKAALGGNTIFVLANGLTILLLTRELLTPTEFGLLYFALSILGMVSMFGILGIPKSAAKYVNEYDEKDESQVPHIIRLSVLYLVGLVAAVSSVLVVGHEILAGLLGEPTVAPFLLLGATYVGGYALHNYLTALLQGFNRIKLSVSLNALSGVGRLVFAVAFVLAGLGAVGAFLGYVAGFVISAAVGAVLLYRDHYAGYEKADRMESGLARRILEYSLPLTVTKGAGVIDKRVDIILVGVFLTPVTVGYYVISKQVASITSLPASSFGYTVSPAYGKRKAADRTDHAARLYERAMRYTLLFYVPACVGLILVAGPAVRLVFGADYAGAVPVVQVMSGFVLANAVNKITSDGLDYLGYARQRALMKSGTAIGNFCLNLVLIPLIGVVGAAAATVITYSVYALGNVYYIHQELSFRVAGVLRDAVVVTAIAVGMASVVVVTVPYVSGLLSLAGVILLGGAVWALLSLLSGLVDLKQVSALL